MIITNKFSSCAALLLLAAAASAAEVTIVGNVLSNVHTGEKEKSLFILAYAGTPEIKAEFDKIIDKFYPDKGLDADAARKLQDQFMAHLKYNISGSVADELYKTARWTARGPIALIGVIEEKDGKKWIAATKSAGATYKFPEKMLSPDKPFIMPEKEPLVLKINDQLSIKCIAVPPGKFLMGEPYYQCPHWQEDPPHLVTLTKMIYIAECPITQEVYEVVMGNNPSKLKGAQLPVHMVSCADMYKFCDVLSAKTKRKVRIPTAAEWEYAARAGTSNPTFPERYAAQNSNATAVYNSAPLPVKSKPANAWGFYDMHSGWWERVADSPNTLDRADATDPQHLPPEDKTEATRGKKHSHIGKGQWTYAISEIEYITSEAGETRFRIVVEEDGN